MWSVPGMSGGPRWPSQASVKVCARISVRSFTTISAQSSAKTSAQIYVTICAKIYVKISVLTSATAYVTTSARTSARVYTRICAMASVTTSATTLGKISVKHAQHRVEWRVRRHALRQAQPIIEDPIVAEIRRFAPSKAMPTIG